MIAGMILTGKALAVIVGAYLLITGLIEACWRGPPWLAATIIWGSIVAAIVTFGGLIGAALHL